MAGSTAGAPPHDWLCLTGGAIGQGLPLAVGAAIACPDRPVVALETQRITGFEALVRWDHPGRSLIPPSEFLPLAEETGLTLVGFLRGERFNVYTHPERIAR